MKYGLSIIVFACSLSMSAVASDELDCLNKLEEFVEVSDGESKELIGKTEQGRCSLSLRYEKYISGLTNEETATFWISIGGVAGDENQYDIDSADGSIAYNDSLSSQKISKCKVDGNRLSIKVYRQHDSGWQNKYRYKFVFTKGESGLTSAYLESKKYRSFWNSGHKSSASCKFAE